MSLLRRLGHGQRVVVVTGLGAALFFVGGYLTSLGSWTGWTGNEVLTDREFYALPGGLHAWVRLLIWLVLIAAWVAASLLVLHEDTPPPGEASGG